MDAFLLESMALMILSGCFRHAVEYINNNNAYTQLAITSMFLALWACLFANLYSTSV